VLKQPSAYIKPKIKTYKPDTAILQTGIEKANNFEDKKKCPQAIVLTILWIPDRIQIVWTPTISIFGWASCKKTSEIVNLHPAVAGQRDGSLSITQWHDVNGVVHVGLE
jgi:hypothetical protein